jgi:NuA3 HAT complex component NTO1
MARTVVLAYFLNSLENFPWWAAVIFEPDDPAVPQKVLKLRPTKSRSPTGHHLVRFYDSSKSW